MTYTVIDEKSREKKEEYKKSSKMVKTWFPSTLKRKKYFFYNKKIVRIGIGHIPLKGDAAKCRSKSIDMLSHRGHFWKEPQQTYNYLELWTENHRVATFTYEKTEKQNFDRKYFFQKFRKRCLNFFRQLFFEVVC